MNTVAPKLWTFSLALVAAVACFLTSTFYAQRQETAISDLSRSIAMNAMPSIERLASARTALRQIDALSDDYVTQVGDARAAVLTQMRAARKEVDDDVDAYLSLPVYPDEGRYWLAIHRSLDRVDNAVASLRRAVANNEADTTPAINEVTAACDDATNAIGADIQFNAEQAASMSRRIEDLHQEARRVAIVLDLASAVLALVIALLALRTVGAHMRLVREKNALLESRADELEQFAGRVAHDIRNPLGAVRLVLAQLHRMPHDARTDAIVARGERSVERALTLLDGLLSFAQAGAHPPPHARASVADVVAGVVEDVGPVATDANVELRVDIESACAIACEPSILAVLVSNLVRNAVKYMGDGDVRRVIVRASTRGNGVARIEVEDTGVGIAPEMRTQIFLPFVRGAAVSDRRGIGLGLATVHKICEAHGGRVWVEPGVDERGSRFCVELPCAKP